MVSRNAPIIAMLAVLPAVAWFAAAPQSSAAPAGQHFVSHLQGTFSDVIMIKTRSRGPRLYVPIAPSYLYYDYPYYRRRGFYPGHIGPGMIYFGAPYSHYVRSSYPRYGSRCSYWHRRCAREWGNHREIRRTKARSFGACTCP